MLARFRSLRLWQRLALIGVAVVVALAVVGALLPKPESDLNFKTKLTGFPLQLTAVTVPAGSEILVQCKYVYGEVVPGHQGWYYVATSGKNYFPVPDFYLTKEPSDADLGSDNLTCDQYLSRHHFSRPPIEGLTS